MPLCRNLPNPCSEWDEIERRNFIASVISGCLFFTGWWIVIDAAVQYPLNEQLLHVYHLVGVVATISMFMVNSINNNQIGGEAITEGCLGPTGSRIWFFLGLMLSFGSVIGACAILFAGYVIPKYEYQWPGVAIFLQNMFIFLSSITFKLGRVEE
ncbi:UNVERIFIED_CONTAM: hypothetical protein GTU68_037940 [Idotea baltica]|nr:hypothetical protein [Idotea baltica]